MTVKRWYAHIMPIVCIVVLALGAGLGTNAWADFPWQTGGSGRSGGIMGGPKNQASVSTPRVQAELVVHAPQGVQAASDAAVWVGLKITHQPGWHTYWKNPGDSGLPTAFVWDLPAGISAGEIQWPVPATIPVTSELVNYGYEGVVLLPVPLHIAPEFNATELQIKLHADWLVCQLECVPEEGNFVLSIPTQQSTLSEVGLFESALSAVPQTVTGVSAQAQVAQVGVVQAGGSTGVLTWRVLGLPADMQGKALRLFPEVADVMVNTGPLHSSWEGDVWTATYALAQYRQTGPAQIPAVLAWNVGDSTQSLQVQALVSGEWPAVQSAQIPPALQSGIDADRAAAQRAGEGGNVTLPVSPVNPANPVNPPVAKTSFAVALLFALLGGLLLNLMPCVFPVLAIKALTFAQSGGHTRRTHAVTGIAYGTGVILTMLALASVLLALRAAGAGLGWGFQLQSPLFVAFLAGLFVLISLNLLGVFEVRLMLPAGIDNLKGKTPALDAFFSGIVSVLIATPCTAPFMGAALGAALVLPAWQTLLIFAALGVGLALPLVLIACYPHLIHRLPKPGAWMQTFRHFMAFPMLATVLWLVWVVGVQTGVNGAMGLLAILLALALFVWVLGWQRQSQQRIWKGIAITLSCLLLLGVSVWFAPTLRQTVNQTGMGASVSENAASTGWQPWSEAKVAQLQAQGKPVFIDFTAAWCATCQWNKYTTLNKPDVLKAFAEQGVTLLQADWTNNDPAITEALQRLGRSGVPVYVLLIPGKTPQLLPEVLTPGMIYEALEHL